MAPQAQLRGKIVMVTGATDGIGKATAVALAALGPTLVVVGRNPAKIAASVAEIKARSGNPHIDSLQADFASLAEVRQLAQQFKARYKRLHVLVNNAANIFSYRGESADGFERTFAINHLAPFLLTNLLLDTIVASAPARIVNVASEGHRFNDLDFDDLQATRSYRGIRAYAQSKLANVLFTYELARRLAGTGVTVNTLHPGGVSTNLGHSEPGLIEQAIAKILRIAGRTPESGAQTSVYLASSPDVSGMSGMYFVNCKPVRSSAASRDVAAQQRLWQISAELSGLATQTRWGRLTTASTSS